MGEDVVFQFMAALARAAWGRPELTDNEAIASVEDDFHISNTDITKALAQSGLELRRTDR